MDSFVQHLLDGLGLGTIYGLLAMGYSTSGCVGRPLVFTNAAASLFGAAVSLMTLVGCGVFGVRFESVALLIAFVASLVAVSAAGWVIGANPHIFAPRQRGFLALLAPAGLVILAVAALKVANQLPATNDLRPFLASRAMFSITGWFQIDFAPEKLVLVMAGAVLFTILPWVIWKTRFGRNFRAISQGRALAELFGINAARTDFITVLISVGLAATAGWMMVLNGAAMDVNDSILTAVNAFAAAIFSGLSSIRRAAAGGFITGTATALWSDFFNPAYGAPVIFAILLFLLAFAPPRSGIGRLTEEM